MFAGTRSVDGSNGEIVINGCSDVGVKKKVSCVIWGNCLDSPRDANEAFAFSVSCKNKNQKIVAVKSCLSGEKEPSNTYTRGTELLYSI